jgi:hypothetical protein
MQQALKWISAAVGGAALAALNFLMNQLGILEGQLPDNDTGLILGFALVFVLRAGNWLVGKLGDAVGTAGLALVAIPVVHWLIERTGGALS